NKKSLRLFLPQLAEWQRAHGYPFELSTEASVNLADDPELLDLMGQANFFAIFVGIESPDPRRWSPCGRSRTRGATSPRASTRSTPRACLSPRVSLSASTMR